MVSNSKCIGTLLSLKSTAIGLSCATAMSPPDATSVMMTYMSQNCGVSAIWAEVNSTFDWRLLTSWPCAARPHSPGIQPAGGAERKSAATTTVAPWMIPQVMNACWYPEVAIMFAMGDTVNADPAPNPA